MLIQKLTKQIVCTCTNDKAVERFIPTLRLFVEDIDVPIGRFFQLHLICNNSIRKHTVYDIPSILFRNGNVKEPKFSVNDVDYLASLLQSFFDRNCSEKHDKTDQTNMNKDYKMDQDNKDQDYMDQDKEDQNK